MGDVVQQCGGKSLGQRAAHWGCSLKCVQPQGLSIASICWAKSHGYAKQADSKWLKICLLGLCLKQQCVKEGIWCQSAFEPLGLSPL